MRNITNCLSRTYAVAIVLCASTSAHADIWLATSLGITPESLAAVGVSSEESAEVLEDLASESELIADLEAQSALAHTAVSEISSLSALINTDCTEETQADYQIAIGTLATIQAQIVILKGQLFQAATDDLTEGKVIKLTNWVETSQRRVPPEFRVLDRTTEQWSAIEQALRAEARAEVTGESLDSESVSLLESIRADSAVVQAAANIASEIASITQVFEGE